MAVFAALRGGKAGWETRWDRSCAALALYVAPWGCWGRFCPALVEFPAPGGGLQGFFTLQQGFWMAVAVF